MPHQCTGCGHVFPDGSKEMLSGCPDCGGNKFQFQPSDRGDSTGGSGQAPTAADNAADAGADPGTPGEASAGVSTDGSAGGSSDEPPEPPEPPGPGGVAGTVAGATERVRNLVSDDDADPGRPPGAPAEDTAQASARSGFVEPDELPAHESAEEPPSGPPPAGADAPASPDASARTDASDSEEPVDSPDLEELRAELNDQFESIKIVERGQYELNLMELYEREEYIISLLEDGRYAIEVPETWRGT